MTRTKTQYIHRVIITCDKIKYTQLGLGDPIINYLTNHISQICTCAKHVKDNPGISEEELGARFTADIIVSLYDFGIIEQIVLDGKTGYYNISNMPDISIKEYTGKKKYLLIMNT